MSSLPRSSLCTLRSVVPEMSKPPGVSPFVPSAQTPGGSSSKLSNDTGPYLFLTMSR